MVYFKRDFTYFCAGAKHFFNVFHFPTALYHIIPTLFHLARYNCLTVPQLSLHPKSVASLIIERRRLMTVVYGTVSCCESWQHRIISDSLDSYASKKYSDSRMPQTNKQLLLLLFLLLLITVIIMGITSKRLYYAASLFCSVLSFLLCHVSTKILFSSKL